MTISLVFWILMLLWLVLGLSAVRYPNLGPAGNLLLFLLLLLLGWKLFGPPIHG